MSGQPRFAVPKNDGRAIKRVSGIPTSHCSPNPEGIEHRWKWRWIRV